MSPASVIDGFDSELEKMRTHWNTPGITCIVVKDGDIVYSGAVGLRDIEKKLPMTTKTLQPIGSTSKAFTSTAVSMLVDDGKLEWDKPLHEQFRKFVLKDPVASSRVSLIDMLSHRTGLPRHDFVWVNDEFTYSKIFDNLPHLEPSKEIRTTFQYCNLMYIAAAALVEEISGVNYREFVKNRIFDPLKMNAVMSVKQMIASDDYAMGYYDVAGKRTATEYDNLYEAQYTAATGAGSINSSIDDMGNWLKFHLSKGMVNGNQLVSPRNLTRTHQSVIMGGYDSLNQWLPDQKWIKQPAYALGWQTDVYRGYSRVRHGGHTDGSSTEMCFLPEEGIGVGAIVNEQANPLANAVVNILIDRLLKLEEVDWSNLLKPSFDAFKKVAHGSSVHEESLKIKETKTTFNLDKYQGKYHHPGYGVLNISLNEGQLKMAFGSEIFPLKHYHYDTFQFLWELFDVRELLTFHFNSYGEIDSLTIRIEPEVQPIRFARLPDDHLTNPEFLKKIIGKYEFYGRTVEMTIKNENILVFNMPGANPTDLIPISGMRFRPKDSTRMSIIFQADDNGEITGFLYAQVGAVILGTRIES
ncbi:MAG: serine hydrolase [Candidatus Thorarchaeota archaeon]